MKNKIESLDAGCNTIVGELLQKGIPKAQWMALEEMVAHIEKSERKSVKGPMIYSAKQTHAIKHLINNALEKRTELKNANLTHSVKSNKESTLLWSTKVQVLLAVMKFSSCHTEKEALNETKRVKNTIVDLIKEYADVYELDIAREVKRVETDLDVMQSLNLLIEVFRLAIDSLLFSSTLSLEVRQEEIQDIKAIEDTLAEGVKKNEIKPKFYQKLANQTRSLVQKMQENITVQRKEIEDLKISKAELEKLVTIDELTEISNRRSFQERFHLEINRMKRKKTPLFLLLLDIDDFKRINDTYGHKAGDKILKAVAEVLEDNIRGIDFIARWGGEEFTVVCPETNEKGAAKVAEKLRKSIETHEFTANYKFGKKEEVVKKERINVTISLGVVEVVEGQDAETVFNMADEASYQAKEQGKNKVVFYSKDLAKSYANISQVEGM